MRRVTVRFLVLLLRFYKRCVSPLLPPACRYLPTCSDYMRAAVEVHGPMKGVWLGTRRLCRCHPWGGHGYDPVPPRVDTCAPRTGATLPAPPKDR